MVDGIQILIWNTTKKLLTIVLKGVGVGSRGKNCEGYLTNVYYKPIWNSHIPCTMNIS
jgi:hypothetical protein